ncbi:unnamed protein product [Closterium sp. Yama58-4]|nr:unnamed protein product [Closterium sp. Yama58-4]
MRRGVSGGQKKRVTTAEALLGAKQVLLLDEISTGLDSATTYQITRCLRNLTHLTNTTTLISLLQPAPETFDLFDDVMLMSEGRIVYHGPREEVLGFFQEMGFAPPARKGVADFLQEVTSLKDQEQYWIPSQPHPYRYVSVRAFEEAFRASRFGKQMEAELSIPLKKGRSTVKEENEGKDVEDKGEDEGKDVENVGEEGKGDREDGSVALALAQRRFGLPPLAMLTIVGDREWLLMKRNLFLYIVQTMQILPLAIVTMSVFWHSQFSITPVDSNYYLGAIFFGISTMLFSGIIELTLLTARLPIYFLQRDNLLFPAWAWCVPMALLSLPVSLWSAGVWTAITYYGIGFAPEFSRYVFLHESLLGRSLTLLTHAALSGWAWCVPMALLSLPVSLWSAGVWTAITYYGIEFAPEVSRAMGAVFRSTTLINTLGNFILVLLFLLSGFLITKDDIHDVWVWVYWISPLTYSQNAFAINEFLAPRWDVPSDPLSLNTTMGIQVLTARSLWTQGFWVWGGLAVGVLFTLLCIVLTILALEYLNPWPRAQPVISQHQLDAREASLAGTNLDFASRYSSLRARTLSRTGSTATARFLASNRFRSPKSLSRRPSPSARSQGIFSSGSPALRSRGLASWMSEGEEEGAYGSHRSRRRSRMGSFLGFGGVSAGAGAGAAGGAAGMGASTGVGTVSSPGGRGKNQHQRKAVSYMSDGGASDGGAVSAVSSTGGEEKQRQRKAVSFMSDGDASEGAAFDSTQRQRKAVSFMSDGGVVSAVSSPGGEVRRGEEKQQQRKAVSFMSDGDASEGAASEPTQRQKRPVSYMSDGDASEGAGGMTASGGEIGQHGMVLPFDPLTLSFHNVNYYVDMPAELKDKNGPPGQRLQLLRNVSGVFRPGVLTALMGVSGAGKTTLMDVLAGRKTGGYIEGDIRVSGYPKVQETFLRVSGYCEQEDIHTPQVTVHESLLYSAWLRLPEEIDRDVILEFVEEVEELVELEPVKGALVGTAGQDGLSVEQRKRLTIAVELVANPSIIFMDEPTSGLDARAAAIVMRAVRNTVNTGRTVVCTIHQPSIDIFESFDELLLMQRGGEVIYAGSLGTHSCDLIPYFKAIPGVPPIQGGANPAAWMLEVTAPAAAERLGVDFAHLFRQSEKFRTIESLIQESSLPPEGEPDLFFPSQHPTTPLSQFATHLWKRHLMYWRMPDYNGARFFFSFFMALLIGGVFFGFGNTRDTPQQIVNVMGALYTAALFLGWSNLASIQPMLAVERSIYYRERGAGMYGAVPYALAQGAIELPYLVIQAVVYSLITYAMIRFEWTPVKFVMYLLFQFLTLLYFTCFGMMTSAITPAEGLGTLLSAFIYSFWNLLCGFLLPQPVKNPHILDMAVLDQPCRMDPLWPCCFPVGRCNNPGGEFTGSASSDYSVRADSVRADSVRADSVRADSVRADSVRADSVRADSVRADSVRADSVRADSVRADSVRADSVRADSVRADSVRADSVRADSVRADSVRADSVRADSVRADSVRADSVRADSVRADSVRADSVRADSVRADSVRADSVRADSVRADSVRADSVRADSVRADSVRADSVRADSVRADSVRADSVRADSVRADSVRADSVRADSVRADSVRADSVRADSVRADSVRADSVRADSVRADSVRADSVRADSVRADSVRADSVRADSVRADSVRADSVRADSVRADSVRADSVRADSVRADSVRADSVRADSVRADSVRADSVRADSVRADSVRADSVRADSVRADSVRADSVRADSVRADSVRADSVRADSVRADSVRADSVRADSVRADSVRADSVRADSVRADSVRADSVRADSVRADSVRADSVRADSVRADSVRADSVRADSVRADSVRADSVRADSVRADSVRADSVRADSVRADSVRADSVRADSVRADSVRADSVRADSVRADSVRADSVRADSVRADSVRADSVRADSVRADSVRADSVRADSVRADSVRADSVRADSVRADSVRADSVRADSVRADSVRADSVRADSVRADSVRADSVRADSVRADSVRADSVRADSVRADSVRADSVRADSVRADSVRADSVRADSVRADSVRADSVRADSVRADSVRADSVRADSVRADSVRADSVRADSVRADSVRADSVRADSVRADSVRADSVRADSVRADSVRADSVRADSVRADSVRADSVRADSVRADSVRADSVRADSVRADSVRADSVRADSVRADSVRADSVRADSVRADSARADSVDRSHPSPHLGSSPLFSPRVIIQQERSSSSRGPRLLAHSRAHHLNDLRADGVRAVLDIPVHSRDAVQLLR